MSNVGSINSAFSDFHSSEFVSIPFNFLFNNKEVLNKTTDEVENSEDRSTSYVDYCDSIINNREDRNNSILFKYDGQDQIPVNKKNLSIIKLHQSRRNTLSRDRVPTRKGLSRPVNNK